MQKVDEQSSKEDQLIATAKNRFQLCVEAESKNRREALEDLKFRIGDQWPQDLRNMRALENRPTLTVNKMPQFLRQVINDQKQNRPAIKISPVDDGADKDTAKVLQGLIRNIENTSDAEAAYDMAFESAANGGFGFFRITTDYVDEKSFDIEPKFVSVENPFNCYIDPYSMLKDGSDAKYGFVVDHMSKEDFKKEFSESKLAKHQDWNHVARSNSDWFSGDDVLICEYFYKEFKKETLIKLVNIATGKEITRTKKELGDENDQGLFVIDNDFYQKIDERQASICTVKWCKLNAIEVLEETIWPGSYIPIIPVYGDIVNVDGKVVREGVIRHAKDPQRILNFWASSEAEAITLAPKAPFIGVEGQFEGHEGQWKTANIKNHAYLEYNPISIGGVPSPPPQRSSIEPAVMAITNARKQANEDIKSTTGIYDASLGARSSETSGIAIQRRNIQAQTSNFHFIDNLNKSIRHAGRILVEIIPKLYDTPRAVRVLGESDEQEIVKINQVFEKNGELKKYDFSYGKYDVTISTGPNYETKRQEARDAMIQMSQANPQFAQVASDLMVKNMDWPGADEIAERLRKILPPNVLESGNDEMKIPPQVQAQMEQMNQMVEALTNELNETKKVIETEQVQISSKERIEEMKIRADLQKEAMKAQSNQNAIILKGEIDVLKQQLQELSKNFSQARVKIEPEENGLEAEFNF